MKTIYERNKAKIKNLETNEVVDYKTIAKAKKESRKIQLAVGVLGNGVLRVAK